MSAISTMLRCATVVAVTIWSIWLNFSAFAVNRESGYTPPVQRVYSTKATSSTVNPFATKLSTENVAQLKIIVDKVIARGANLSQDKFVAYLTKISDGIKTLGQKPVYASNETIQNIVSYIDYELTTKRDALTSGTSFLDEFGNIVDEATSQSGTGETTATGTVVQSAPPVVSYVNCIGFNGPSRGEQEKVVSFEMPKYMTAEAISKGAAYQRYLSCTKNTLMDVTAYVKTYGVPPGFTPGSGDLLNKTDGMRDWEKTNLSPIEYGFNHDGKLFKISGIRYDGDDVDNTPQSDEHGCLKWSAWWSEEEQSCVGYYVALNRTDSNMGSVGYKDGDYMLNWGTSGMSKCEGSGAWSGAKPLNGNITMPMPATSQIYTLTCTGKVIRNGKSITVTQSQSVTLDPRPKITSLSVSGGVNDNGSTTLTTIKLGGAATVRWASVNANTCRIYDGSTIAYEDGEVPASGTLTISPKASYTFTIRCTGDGGETQVKYFGINVR